jgi:nucleotide-binding universal stress UspA family protein
MPTLQRVLVATDLSEASRTPLGYAAALSRRLSASLTALYVSPRYASYEQFPTFPSQAALDPARRQGLEDQGLEDEVRRFVESAAGPQPVEVVVRDGDPADEILAAAAESTFDLVVLGTHGRRGFERWSLGSVTDRVARGLERSLLTVPPHARPPAANPRMLCALDLSDASAEVLAYAAWFAELLEGRLLALYVAEGSHWYDPWPISGLDQDAIRRAVAESAERRLAELVARHVPRAVPMEVRVSFGRAHREIERIASDQIDVVVLGLPSTRGVDRLFFGSTVQHVLRAGACPVLLVRHAPAAQAPAA